MLGGVFICYRREDSGGFAGRIYDRLISNLGRENVFFDVDSIAPGLDFVDTLSERVGRCDALIVVIGKTWLLSADADKKRRLDDPNDFVRVEIEAALNRGVRVIPVLVDGALLPKREDLPASIDKLTRRQGIEISHARFDSDVENLIRALSELEEEVRQRAPAGADRVSHETIAKPQDGGAGDYPDPKEPVPARPPGASAVAVAAPVYGLPGPTLRSGASSWRLAVPVAGAIVATAALAAMLYGSFGPRQVEHMWRPSFDCRLAQFKAEFMICDNEELSQLDNALAATYRLVRESLTGADQKRLDNEEAVWVAERNTCSTVECIKQKNNERIAALKGAMSNKP